MPICLLPSLHLYHFYAYLINILSINIFIKYISLQNDFFRFKDKLVMPLRTDILLVVNLMGPSLESLPIELRTKIANMLTME